MIGTAAGDNLQKYLESADCVLQRIILCNCQIGGDSTLLVAAARCPTMLEMNVSRNPFSDLAGLNLCAAIASSSSLRHLDISFLKLAPRVIEAIVAATFRSDNKQDMTLVLNGNDLGEEVGAKIASLLSGCDSIHKLHLDNCELSQSSIMLILKCLTGRKIVKLSLAGNVLEGEQRSKAEVDTLAQTLAAFIRETKTIEELSIADNGTARAKIDILPMVEMMKQGHGKLLKTLDIQGNSLGDEGIVALADHLVQNTTLHSLFLDHNNIKVCIRILYDHR